MPSTQKPSKPTFRHRFASIFKVKANTVNRKGMRLQLIESEETKLLNYNGSTISKINKNSIYTHGYWDYFLPIAFLWNKPRILLIGLGGGTTPYQLHKLLHGNAKIDAVEVDDYIAKIARRFVPRTVKYKTIIGDGSEFVKKTQNKYDIVILDAYIKNMEIPKQFISKEFMENAYNVLNTEGILAINYVISPTGLLNFWKFASLLREKFTVYKVKTSALGDILILLCCKNSNRKQIISKIKRTMRINDENAFLIRRYEKMRPL